jgi:hypothetical protein
MKFITSDDQWLEEYRKDKYKTWIRATLSDNLCYRFSLYEDWMDIKDICELNKLQVIKLGLQYRSHIVEIDTGGADGVYLAKSIIGTMGESAKHAYTIGKIYGNIVKKTMWITPELLEEFHDEDTIETCFKEALIFNDNTKQQAGTI